MANIPEEEVIRRKLLIDGDGMGDDRRLNMFLRMFLKWCNALDAPAAERSLAYEKLQMTLAQCQFAMNKSQQMLNMNSKEMQRYEALTAHIEASIQEAQNQILKNKEQLKKAKQIRRNRQEYHALAQVIEEEPDRKATLKELQELEKTISQLQEEQQNLSQKLEQRHKQFHVLLSAVARIQNMVNEDEEQTGELPATPEDAMQTE